MNIVVKKRFTAFIIFSLLVLSSPHLVKAVTSTFQIISSGDDVNEDNTTFSTTDSPMWVGNASSATASYLGLRFQTVSIPKDATITSAHLEFNSSQAQWHTISFTLGADASGNSPVFSTTAKPSQRTLGSQLFNHTSNTNWATNTWYAMDEIAPIIQQVVNRSDWASGNSISLVLKGTSTAWGRKFIKSYDGGAATAARLVVDYTTGTITPTPTITLTLTPTLTSTPTLAPTITPNPSFTATPTVLPTNTPLNSPTPTVTNTTNLTGIIYLDTNQNGVNDVSEVGYANASITLTGPVNQTTTTTASGSYSFNNLTVGLYQATLTVPSGYLTTTANPATISISGSPTQTQNFGLAPVPSSSATDWPQLQFNAQHIGRTSVQVNPNYSAKWVWMDKTHIVKNFVSATNKSITDGIASGFTSTIIFSGQMQPITAAGKTFFGATNGVFYAVNSLTGDNLWDYPTDGPIFATAAYDNGVVTVPSMDGKLYGINVVDGSLKWAYQTGAGISAAPVISSGTVYIGSRDGSFYAVDVQTGNLKWKYDTRDPLGKFNKAPIVAAAAVSEDGNSVFFGAENMNFYGLDTTTGLEKWTPKFMIGQSFQYSWPVVSGTKVIVRTMSSIGGTETVMDSVLSALPTNPDWLTSEKPAIANWLVTNPERKTMYVIDGTTGAEPYEVAMGTVGGGSGMTPHPPVIDNQGRVLTYWRTKVSTFLGSSPTYSCFGTSFCPDISAMDMATGNRITIPNSNGNKFHPEIDNTFFLSVGGSNLYFDNDFRGTISINLATGLMTRITHSLAYEDGGNFRGWPYQIIYYGNDSQQTDNRPPTSYSVPDGWIPVALAQTGSTPMMYVTETAISAIVGITGQ